MLNNVMKGTHFLRRLLWKTSKNIFIGQGDERQHMVIIKNPRPGKSSLLKTILPHVNKKRTIVIYDKNGSFIDQPCMREKDIILNPFEHYSSIYLGPDTKELK